MAGGFPQAQRIGITGNENGQVEIAIGPCRALQAAAKSVNRQQIWQLDGGNLQGVTLVTGIAKLWGVPELTAGALAAALVGGQMGRIGPGGPAHLLRFAHHDPELQETGGYSLVLIG